MVTNLDIRLPEFHKIWEPLFTAPFPDETFDIWALFQRALVTLSPPNIFLFFLPLASFYAHLFLCPLYSPFSPTDPYWSMSPFCPPVAHHGGYTLFQIDPLRNSQSQDDISLGLLLLVHITDAEIG